MMNKTILLHSLPSSVNEEPIMAFPTLKSYIAKNGYDVKIIYWDIILRKQLHAFFSSLSNHPYNPSGTDILSLFTCLLSLLHNDSQAIQKNIFYLQSKFPDAMHDNSYLLEILEDFSLEMKRKIRHVFKSYDSSQIISHGFTSRFNQWIPACYFSNVFKELTPNLPIIIGGLDTKEEAISILKMSSNFNFTIWGEGESPFLNLINALECKSKASFDNIPRLVYKDKTKITPSDTCESELMDINCFSPSFNDYFNTLKRYKYDRDSLIIPIENQRGCSWNKCKFCVLNLAYQEIREKDHDKIIEEIDYLYNNFNITCFSFTGSDLISNNLSKTKNFLDKLISLKENLEDEIIFHGEIIPHHIDQEIASKLSVANFVIQIGYEATGDTLLNKLNKKTRFADLLLFLKLAKKYNIVLNGVNILQGLPDEEKSDIIEAAYNIPFLRFFLGDFGLIHNYIPLRIKQGSSYYNEIDSSLKEDFKHNILYDLCPSIMIDNLSNRFSLFAFSKCSQEKHHRVGWF